jgi:hypothetical protein
MARSGISLDNNQLDSEESCLLLVEEMKQK